jgi:hypothetical protein
MAVPAAPRKKLFNRKTPLQIAAPAQLFPRLNKPVLNKVGPRNRVMPIRAPFMEPNPVFRPPLAPMVSRATASALDEDVPVHPLQNTQIDDDISVLTEASNEPLLTPPPYMYTTPPRNTYDWALTTPTPDVVIANLNGQFETEQEIWGYMESLARANITDIDMLSINGLTDASFLTTPSAL